MIITFYELVAHIWFWFWLDMLDQNSLKAQCSFLHRQPHARCQFQPGVLSSHCRNGLMYKPEHWFCALLAGLSLALPLKSKLTSTVVGPRLTIPTAKDMNNDVFALHSAPLALTATTYHHGPSAAIIAAISVGQWWPICTYDSVFYGDNHVLIFLCGRDSWRRGDNRRAPLVLWAIDVK